MKHNTHNSMNKIFPFHNSSAFYTQVLLNLLLLGVKMSVLQIYDTNIMLHQFQMGWQRLRLLVLLRHEVIQGGHHKETEGQEQEKERQRRQKTRVVLRGWLAGWWGLGAGVASGLLHRGGLDPPDGEIQQGIQQGGERALSVPVTELLAGNTKALPREGTLATKKVCSFKILHFFL